jgi:hypothetical protein
VHNQGSPNGPRPPPVRAAKKNAARARAQTAAPRQRLAERDALPQARPRAARGDAHALGAGIVDDDARGAVPAVCLGSRGCTWSVE